jgi:hypothetical protein
MRVDNDQYLDIVTIEAYTVSPGTMRIYRNNGNGTFAAPVVTNISSMGHLSDIVDLDGDGIGDYLGNVPGSPFVVKYSLGNGDGTFDPPVTVLSDRGGVSAGDLNNDGKIDLLNTRYLFFNQGGMNFTEVDISAITPQPTGVADVRDFNGDGRADFLAFVSTGGAPRFYLLTSTGTSVLRTDFIVSSGAGVSGSTIPGNFIGNSAPDIAFSFQYSNQKVVYENDGAGNFTRRDYDQRLVRYNNLRSVAGDFDNDGRVDLVQATSATNGSKIMLRDVTSLTFLRTVCDRPGQTRVVDFVGLENTSFSYWNPSSGAWSFRSNPYYFYSSDPIETGTTNWGSGSHGDIPAPGDFDGDGITDRAVFRNSTGVWYILRSSDQAWHVIPFGLSGDKPVVGDYDGDTISDIAVWRPSDGNWYVWYMGPQQFGAGHFGTEGDKPSPADFDGDLKTDWAVYRPSTGQWHVLRSSDLGYFTLPWGISTDRPIPADYDGDGKADIAVHRESNGYAYIIQSSDGTPVYYPFGLPGDVLQIGDYDGDYVADIGVYRPSTREWRPSTNQGFPVATFGDANVMPTSSVVKSE